MGSWEFTKGYIQQQQQQVEVVVVVVLQWQQPLQRRVIWSDMMIIMDGWMDAALNRSLKHKTLSFSDDEMMKTPHDLSLLIFLVSP